MASLTVRNLEEPLKARLRVRAAHHGRSMEEEVRLILKTTLEKEAEAPLNLAKSIRKRFAPLGGVNLPEIPRETLREPPRLTR